MREKYRKVPLSLREGAHSEMDLPIDERIPLHNNLNSPRARPKFYSTMIKTTSTPDLRVNRQQLRNEENISMKLSPKWNNETKTTQYGTYQSNFLLFYSYYFYSLYFILYLLFFTKRNKYNRRYCLK